VFFRSKKMSYGNYPDLNGVKKILVVKLRQLGDVLLTGPVFSALKARCPEAKVDAYVYTEAFPMLEGHPALGEMIGYDKGWKKLGFLARLWKEWLIWRRIRKEGYDVVVNLTEGDRGAMAAWVSGARVRVGFQPKGRLQRGLYTHVVKHCPGLRHTVERNLDAVRRIGIFPEERELFLRVKKAEGMGKFVLIHPSSRWKFKCWPKMRELVAELVKRGRRVVLTSGPDREEMAMVAEIAAGLDVVNLSGKIGLSELGGLIEASELVVCVDSVPFHMANALKKRVVAIFGPTSEVSWGPWRNEHARVVAQKMSCRPCYQDGCGGSKMSDCLATLGVGAVLTVVDALEAEVFAEVCAPRLRIVDQRIGCP
jgi:heptosyltransferase-3